MVTRPGTLQASFNSGEVAPELYARNDVKQFYASAALMRNVEPVAQGGFRLSDRSRDLGGQRSFEDVTRTLVLGTPGAGAYVVATATFPAAVALSAVQIVSAASIEAPGSLIVEYQTPGGAWLAFKVELFSARTAFGSRVAARSPGGAVAATAVRVAYNGSAGAATFPAFDLFPFREVDATSTGAVQLVAFTVQLTQTYEFVLDGPFLADVYRDGAWVGTARHGLTADQVRTVTALQRLETLLLFHADVGQIRIRRGAGDYEWATDPMPATETPLVDLGGTYAKVNELWQIALRWPTSVSPVGYGLSVSVDAQETATLIVPAGPDWTAYAATLKSAIEALATVAPGITIYDGGSGAGYKLYNIEFGGAGNTGSEFTVSAKFVNTAEGGATAIRLTKGDAGGEPLFSDAAGYPRCGTFYQDRLIQGGFRSKPGAVLASPSSDYFSGNIEVVAPSGGVLVNIDTDGAETIQRLARSKHLVIMTSDAEYFVSDRVLRRDQPMNIVESSRNGSAATVPICTTETSLIYVSRTRSLIYTAAYDDVAQAYVSTPLSLLAKHLIKGISGAALQRANDQTDAARYFAVRDDGLMICGHIIQSQDVTAFVRWETDGKVLAVGVDGLNRVYLSVERIIAGVARRRVEWLEPGLLLDGAVTRTFGSPSATVSGLDLHEGASVWAIADGYALGPYLVVAGTINLPIAVSTAIVGRWTPPAVMTLPLPRDVGPRIVNERLARVHTVQLKVLGTTSVALGANGQTPEDVPLYRAGMPTDLPQQPVSDWLELPGLEGYSIDAQVMITQLRPGPLQVAAVVVQARV